jgi:hypothetical protein
MKLHVKLISRDGIERMAIVSKCSDGSLLVNNPNNAIWTLVSELTIENRKRVVKEFLKQNPDLLRKATA